MFAVRVVLCDGGSVSIMVFDVYRGTGRLHGLGFCMVLLYISTFVSKRTLRAGKLTEKILKLFVATGKDEILSLIQALNIQHVHTPVLPTRCSEKF